MKKGWKVGYKLISLYADGTMRSWCPPGIESQMIYGIDIVTKRKNGFGHLACLKKPDNSRFHLYKCYYKPSKRKTLWYINYLGEKVILGDSKLKYDFPHITYADEVILKERIG